MNYASNHESGSAPGEITRILRKHCAGDEDALNEVIPKIYDELRQAAASYLKGEGAVTMPPTALVHEVYLRLSQSKKIYFRDRRELFYFAGQLMRQVLVDLARTRLARKRQRPEELNIPRDEAADFLYGKNVDVHQVLALDESLKRLETLDARQCRIVELRFFAGLSIEEIAEHLGLSAPTVKRDWRTARLWLAQAF